MLRLQQDQPVGGTAVTRQTKEQTVFARGANRVGLAGIKPHWTEATCDTYHDAAPEVVVAALLDQVEHYNRLLQDERKARYRAERRVDRFVAAANDVLEVAAREQLDLREVS